MYSESNRMKMVKFGKTSGNIIYSTIEAWRVILAGCSVVSSRNHKREGSRHNIFYWLYRFMRYVYGDEKPTDFPYNIYSKLKNSLRPSTIHSLTHLAHSSTGPYCCRLAHPLMPKHGHILMEIKTNLYVYPFICFSPILLSFSFTYQFWYIIHVNVRTCVYIYAYALMLLCSAYHIQRRKVYNMVICMCKTIHKINIHIIDFPDKCTWKM